MKSTSFLFVRKLKKTSLYRAIFVAGVSIALHNAAGSVIQISVNHRISVVLIIPF